MSKYIPQLNETDFVYPNFEISEYDVDIIHNINNNSVSGIITDFVLTGTARTTGFTITHSNIWYLNGAEPFFRTNGALGLYSLHMLAAGQNYYKPWRIVDVNSTLTTGSTTFNTTSRAVTITPSMMGLTTFSSGTYYFEFRFIGLKSIYAICQTLSITVT